MFNYVCMYDYHSVIYTFHTNPYTVRKEKIIYRRLETFLGAKGLSDRQFSFRKSRSTIDALAMIMAIAKDAISGKRLLEGDKEFYAIIILDVKNAFSSAD